ncbi:unnamed protein product, partial [Mesorhabditis spiculigera]
MMFTFRGFIRLLILFPAIYAYRQHLELTIKGSEEIIEQAVESLQKSLDKDLLSLDITKERKEGHFVELQVHGKTWTKGIDNQMMMPAQKEHIGGVIVETIRGAGIDHARAFQDPALHAQKWRELAHELVQHRLENPGVLKKFVAGDEHRFALFYNDEGGMANHHAAVIVSLARREMEGAEVIIIDCTHDVFKCGEYVDVAHFPTLRYYRDKKLQKAWTTELDMMTVEDISDLVIRSIDDTVHRVNEDLVPYWREGMLEGYGHPLDTVHLFFGHDENEEAYRRYQETAEALKGHYTFGALIDEKVSQWATHPAIITMKPQDTETKAVAHHKEWTVEALTRYIRFSSRPLLHDLSKPREAVEAIDSDCVLLFLFDPKMAVAARPLYELAQDIEYRETVPLVVGTVNGTSPFGLAFSTWAGLKQFDRAQWVLVNHNEEIDVAYVLPVDPEKPLDLKKFVKKPEEMAKARESTLHLDFLKNVALGENFEDCRGMASRKWHEPGTLPRPPLHNEAHDEL